ncbi:MAG TPA: hypothetical protein VED40_09620 [Azospirillaceae bacterium]|nr:hypothetical protein [Azospirillaceae bacterium]
MGHVIGTAALVLLLTGLTGGAAASPCGEAIGRLQAQIDEGAEAAISSSSGGQGVAGAREGQALEAERRDAPVREPAAPYQKEGKEAQAVQQAADAASGGGDGVMRAKAALNRARALDQKGDAACRDAVAEAEALLRGRP